MSRGKGRGRDRGSRRIMFDEVAMIAVSAAS